MAQSLNKMNWLNEPQQWEIKDGKTLVMDVPAKTDFWRISHYGFTVDDGPFYYATYGGEFEAKVKITGNYVTTFDQMGLMLRIDHENWIKAGVEYVDGKQNVSAVVTHRTSDWSVVQLPDAPRSIWIKAVRRLVQQFRIFVRKGKVGNEQRYGKPDTAQQGDARYILPVHPRLIIKILSFLF